VMSAADARPKKARGAEYYILKQTGPAVIRCGTFVGSPYRRQRKLGERELRTIEDCMTKARDEGRAFFFLVGGTEVDSWAATGLLGTTKGDISVFWYDDDPCGGRGCTEAFELYSCVPPAPGERIDPLLKCTDRDFH
jgi:hypothetical protein